MENCVIPFAVQWNIPSYVILKDTTQEYFISIKRFKYNHYHYANDELNTV